MTLQEIKHQFYTYRNGALADSMRRLGAPYKIIFGLNLPQLSAIAREVGKDAELSQQLWENKSTRESLLLAPMIYPGEMMDKPTALRWVNEIPSTEVSDILCMKLLRDLPFADELADELMLSDNPMTRYTALRILFNLLGTRENNVRIAETKGYAESELALSSPITLPIATSILSEINYLLNPET